MALAVQESSIYSNAMIKDYGTYKQLIVFKNNVRRQGYEEVDIDCSTLDIDDIELNCELNSVDNLQSEKNEEVDNANKERSLRRSRQMVRNIAHLNDWTYFMTLTFDKEKVKDRYDYDDLFKKVSLYFKKQKAKHKDIRYMYVAEPHKDGALHFHGLLYDPNCELNIFDSGFNDEQGRNIFKLKSWEQYKGYSNLTKIDDHIKVANYISKYITKESQRLLKHYYYSSKGLKREPKITYCDGVTVDSLLSVYNDDVYENTYCYIVNL